MKKKLFLHIIQIFVVVSCVSAQVRADLPLLEQQLCFIQKTLGGPYDNSSNSIAYYDSLQMCYPLTLSGICVADKDMEYEFKELQNYITIAKSADGNVKVFTRNTYLGGSMPQFESYIQFKSDGKAHFFDINEEQSSGVRYDTVYTVRTQMKTYYILSGITQIMNLYPMVEIRAISFSNGHFNAENIFVSDGSATDRLSVCYRYTDDVLDPRLYAPNTDTYPRIVYVDGQILKPIVVDETITQAIEVFKQNTSQNEIKFTRDSTIK